MSKMENEQAKPDILEVPDVEMLLGTMRDHILDGVKPHIGWERLKEVEQRYINNVVEQCCRSGIRGAVSVAAAMTFPSIEVTPTTRSTRPTSP